MDIKLLIDKLYNASGQLGETFLCTQAARMLEKQNKKMEILIDALAEIKATNDGNSDQPINKILEGCLEEIRKLP